MQFKLALAGAALLLASQPAVAQACTQGPAWSLDRADLKLAATFPNQPSNFPISAPGGAGTAEVWEDNTIAAGCASVSLIAIQYASAGSNAQGEIDRFLGGQLSNTERVLRNQRTTLFGSPARDALYTWRAEPSRGLGVRYHRSLSVYRNGSVYQARATWTGSDQMPANAQRFFDSFKVR